MMSSRVTSWQISISVSASGLAQSRFTDTTSCPPKQRVYCQVRAFDNEVLPAPLAPTKNTAFILQICLPQQRIIQMDRLLTVFLRRQLQQHQLRHAFGILKNHDRPHPAYLSFRDQRAFGSLPESVPSVEIQNREQYLKYMEEVLLNKEKELGQLQQSLMQQKQQQEMEQARTSIIGPLTLTHQSESLNKKIKVFKEIMLKYVTLLPEVALDKDFQELIDSLHMVEASCKNNYNQLKNELLKNHQQLSLQRDQLASKLTKLKELQSYQKYLNELQKILENKEFQLIERESQLQDLNPAPRVAAPGSYQGEPQQFNTFQEENTGQSEVSVRKRRGIFQQKADKEDQLHKDSSKIMQEISAEDSVPQVNPDSYTTTIDSSREKDQRLSKSLGIQTIAEDPRVSAACRINSSAIYIKFLKLWFRTSGNSTRGTTQHSATMLLYRWRVNALYDEDIAVSAREVLVWPKKSQGRGDLPFEDYARLSLRKQVYLENYFGFQRQKFQKKKMQSMMGSILKNKNRKERLAVMLTFRKYRQTVRLCILLRMEKSSCSSREYPLRQVTTQNSQNLKSSQANKQSRLLSNSSLFVEDPQRLSHSKSKISKKNGIQSSHLKPRGNAKDLNVDLNKLKEYIKTQEATEARLATECAQTQSVFRLANVLKRRVSCIHHSFMVGLVRWGEDSRADELHQVVSSYEFKWELFMAKARLALTSNSNKIAHLEQLVSFIDK